MNIKRYIPRILSVLTLIILVITVSGHVAQAQTVNSFFAIPTVWDLFLQMLAYVVYAGLTVASWAVIMTAGLLNLSIVFTLHIKDFVNSTPAIYQIWQAIRDISGMFFIFFLLYAGIKLILGLDQNFGSLIKNIVIAGILINFSFFVTSVMIDASNVVSQAIYNSMIPNQPTITQTDFEASAGLKGLTQKTFTNSQGGISDIFMQSLQIQPLFNANVLTANGANLNDGSAANKYVGAPIKMVLVMVSGIVIMITTSLSFLLAALAFIARLVILLFLLAFSPIWFAAMVIPQLGDYAKKFTTHLKAQLLFMPVYLLLMYVALSILNNSKVFGASYTNLFSGSTGSSALWGTDLIVLGINFALVIFMLNLPLIVAVELGGSAASWIDMKKFGADAIWKKVGSQAGSRTAGRMAYSLNKNVTPWISSRSSIAGSLVSKGLSSVSTAGFGVKKGGYEDRLKAKKKSQEGLHKQIGTVDRGDYRTDAEFDAARERAKKYHAAYRTNLPWKGYVGGVIGFMVDNRGNRQTASKLNKDASKEAKKEAKKTAQDANKKIQKDLDNLDTLRNSLETEARSKTGEERGRFDKRIKELDEEKRRLRKVREENNEKIQEGKDVEEEDRSKKIIDDLDELKNREEKGGGGDKGK